MKKFLEDNNIVLNKSGKISIPNYIKHIKLDIGLSYNAPQSQLWLSEEKDLLVFGFEPNFDSVKSIISGAKKRESFHGECLNIQYIKSKNFLLIPCALGKENKEIDFFSTADDIGCSSIYKPTYHPVSETYKVQCFTLKSFFDLFPFEDFPLIEYIKVDAQGSDLDIIKSGGDYIKNNIVIITLEASTCEEYINTNNNVNVIHNYMLSIDFEPHISGQTIDPTYINKRFKDQKVYIKQI